MNLSNYISLINEISVEIDSLLTRKKKICKKIVEHLPTQSIVMSELIKGLFFQQTSKLPQ